MSTRDQREYLEVLGYAPALGCAPPFTAASAGSARAATPQTPIRAPLPAQAAAATPPIARPVRPSPVPVTPSRLPRMTAPTSSASSASDWSLVAHGPTNARLVYICEAPAHAASAEGELLSKMTVAMGLDPAQVLVIEIAGGDPESSVLTPLEKLLVPALASAAHVVAFGNLPARAALRTQDPMSNLRGRAHASPLLAGGARLWATYAPSLCIRNANMKKPVWEDLQQLMKELS